MKISLFLGRVHHAQKLLPICIDFQERGVDIEFIIANNSINIDPTTEYLHKFGIEVFHHVNDYIGLDISKVDDYVSSADFDKAIFASVPPFWVLSSLRESAECLVGFDNYLKQSKPDAVFGLHENNFWVKMFFYTAKQHGIRTFSLQEGIILEREEHDLEKYSLGTNYTDILFSWSEHDKQFYSDKDKIIPVGPSHLDNLIVAVNNKRDRDNLRGSLRAKYGIKDNATVVAFMPPRLDLYRGDFNNTLHKLVDWTRDRGMVLLLSLHPFQGGADQLYNTTSIYPHVVVRHDIQGTDYIILSDVVITQTSTIGLEAVLLNTPLIEIDVDYVGLEQPLWKQGAATLLEGDNFNIIRNVLSGNTVDTSSFINDRFILADGQSTRRIAEVVLND